VAEAVGDDVADDGSVSLLHAEEMVIADAMMSKRWVLMIPLG
jgi:hypothetical protein